MRAARASASISARSGSARRSRAMVSAARSDGGGAASAAAAGEQRGGFLVAGGRDQVGIGQLVLRDPCPQVRVGRAGDAGQVRPGDRLEEREGRGEAAAGRDDARDGRVSAGHDLGGGGAGGYRIGAPAVEPGLVQRVSFDADGAGGELEVQRHVVVICRPGQVVPQGRAGLGVRLRVPRPVRPAARWRARRTAGRRCRAGSPAAR